MKTTRNESKLIAKASITMWQGKAYDLTTEGSVTRVSLTQDNNATDQAREHSEGNWGVMLGALKRHVEA